MERFQKLHNRRLRAIIALMTAIALFFTALLYLATIANGLSDGESTELNTVVTTATENAARGNITDRYGEVLVTNRTEYNVTLDVGNMGESKEQLETLSTLLDICKAQKVKWTDEDLPISTDTPYTFTTDTPFLYQTDDGKWTQTRLGKLCKAMDWSNSSSTTASQLVAQMKQSFGLDTGKYTESQVRELLGVLYSCYLREKEVLYTTYLFAEDVDIDLISVIKEKDLPGVEILPMSTRQYNTSAAALLLGQTGPISAESWEEKKDYYQKNNYNMDAIVGLSGAEYAFEEYLRGTPGTKKVILGNDGKTLTERYSVEPKVGSNVALTLDSKLQEATEKALAEVTPKINNGKGGSAAVVLNIKDGSILAAATYPTFDAARYNKDYKKLAKDKLNPLFNRALLGIYAPGSTYKMCTAAAGVETGAINVATTHYECKGSMTYYGHTYHCWETRGQGTEYLADAVRDSCNIFFYNVGINTGIKALTKKAQEYGLGEATGVELSESTGVNAGPAYSEKMGTLWTDGNTLSAAIGQSDNQFSPLQLANYVATLIHGGDRYKAHLLKTVKSSDNSKILYQYQPEVVKKVPLEQDAYDAIKKGMGEVIEADKIKEFDNLQDRGIKVGCKTGTAEVGTSVPKLYNALLVSFAPYDNPEIAVCTVVEKSPSQGASTAAITAAIMEYYFSEDAVQERVAAENKLVS